MIAMDRFLKSYVYGISDNWQNLEFNESGLARLSHICGFFRGLVMCGKQDLAEAMAADLDRQLYMLNVYGGESDLPTDVEMKFPRFRVVLSDDGTFGGFAVQWFRLISNEQRLAKAKEIHKFECRQEYDEPEYEKTWYQSLAEAEKSLQIRESLKLYRYGVSAHCEAGHYGYSHHGGLLLHGFGEVFAVNLPGTMKFWSIHT